MNMANGESGLKTRILEIVRTTKAQKEPLTAGSQYEDTKRVIQSYEEQWKYLKARLDEAQDELKACKAVPTKAIIVGDGYTVKGYGFLVPLHDDFDIVSDLELAVRSLKESYGLGMYLDNPAHHGKMVLYPYPVKELALLFPEFCEYDLVNELSKMARSCKASFGVQVYSGALRSVEQAIKWEENASMIVGNKELAERLKESDTTLLVSLAAGAQEDDTKEPARLPKEPSKAEIEAALQQMAAKDLEIATPSKIPASAPVAGDDKLTGIDVVNEKRSKKKIKAKEKNMKAAKPKKAGAVQ
jgi:hypothetical protein